MSFLSIKTTCSVCNGEAGLTRKRIANKQWMCSKCFKRSNVKLADFTNKSITKWTADDFNKAIQANIQNQQDLEAFNPTKKIGKVVEFDDNQKKWLVLSSILGRRDKSIVYNYSDIVDFELLEDGESVSQGGLGRALVGGALFGGTGAVVGGITGKRKNKTTCNSLRIKITINDMDHPVVYINFLESSTKKNGIIYKSVIKEAQECLSVLQLICDEQESLKSTNNATGSVVDEMRKFKTLLDDGIITEEEFEIKRKELLNL